MTTAAHIRDLRATAPLNDVRPRVLVADDERVNRLMLKRLLEDGYEVFEACDGHEAVEVALERSVDVVLIDVQMPGMDGYDATKLLKQKLNGRVVPVVFMTATNDEDRLARGIACGGDDFVTKPISKTLLRSKIAALLRMRDAFEGLRQQKDELAYFRTRAERDFAVAQEVFSAIVHRGGLDLPHVHHRLFSMDSFNGDLVLAAPMRTGRLRMLVGDFAGHGLSAAIGGLPVAETFYKMAEVVLPLDEVVRELNAKLRRILPKSLFLSALLADIDLRNDTVRYWNGGIPDAIVAEPKGNVRLRLPSTHLPLGVADLKEVDITEVGFRRGERLLIYSDGVIETHDTQGELFGEERLIAALSSPTNTGDWLEPILAALAAFRGTAPQSDDITLLGVAHEPALARVLAGAPDPSRLEDRRESSVAVTLDPRAMRDPDPLRPFVRFIESHPRLCVHSTELFSIIAELYSNALEHGILGLDSRMKDEPDGFERYYRERTSRLATLVEGLIEVAVDVVGTGPDRSVVVRVRDSGTGCIVGRATSPAATSRAGRGLAIVRGLCREVRFFEAGRLVEATFPLQSNEAATGALK